MAYIKTNLKRELIIDSIVTLHYFEYTKNIVFKGESHNFWEFLYVDNGTLSVTAGDEKITLATGDIIFHEPNEFHAFESVGKTPPNLVVFSFSSSSPAICFFRKKHFTLTNEERVLISRILSEGKKTFRTPMNDPSVEQVILKRDTPFASQQMILLYLEMLLINLYRNNSECQGEFEKYIQKAPQKSQSSRDALFTQIVSYMETNICEQLRISEICETFSISRSTLHSLFFQRVNCGTIDYFNSMKIQKAKEIIRNGTMNFTEIAYYLSFNSLPYFSKRFKSITGMSPTEYASSVQKMADVFGDTPSSKRRK